MQGFLGDSLTSEYAFSHKSKSNNNNVSPEQFKTLSYINKIHTNIQSAWNVKKHKLKGNENINTFINFSLIIDKNGNINSLELLSSTGIAGLDDLIVETIKFAAPFSKIPKHFNKETFELAPTYYIRPY